MTNTKKALVGVSTIVLSLVGADFAFAQDATIKVGGRLMLDYTIADFDEPSSTINNSRVRRARLFASGNYGDSIKYKVEFNKSTGSSVELTDAYIQFVPQNSKFKVKVGQFKTHNSMEEETSSRFTTTLERGAYTDAFGLDRRIGVSVNTSGDNYGFDLGVFGTNVELQSGMEEGYALAGRGYYNPVKSDDTVAHLGASWRYRNQGDTESDIRYRQRPYTNVAADRIINTGRFAESDNFYAGEALYIKDNFWAASEYSFLQANGSDGNEDADFSGGYAEIGVVIGGRQTYKGGRLNRPQVDNPVGEGGMGALSLVARYDTLDLEDGPYVGQLDTFVLGADWWATKQARLGLNFFNVEAEDGTAESGSGVLGRLSIDF